MKNYWLSLSDKREIFDEIDEKIVDAWIEDKTIGDLIDSLTEEEKKVFLSLKITDCGAELTESQLDISIKLPEFERLDIPIKPLGFEQPENY
jgi:hypothetical protein